MRHTALMLAAGLVLAGCGGSDEEAPGGNPGTDPAATPAPEIQADYWLNAEPLSLAGLRGSVVVVEFWATWCPPCRTSIPHLIRLNDDYAPQGVVFVSLTDEPRDTVEPFAERMNMDYAIGGGSPSGRTYGVQGIPRAFIIDRSGRVVWEGHPMDPKMEQELAEAVSG